MSVPERTETLRKIKSRGYWRITFYPPGEPKELITLPEAKRLLTTAAIDLTGWDYPHVPTADNDHQQRLQSVGTDFVEGVTDFQKFKEIVRLYRIGLFHHVVAVWEDWFAEESWYPAGHPLKSLPPGEVIDFLSINTLVTEIFLFLKNLTEATLYPDGAVVTVELHGVTERRLTTLDPSRMPLRDKYACAVDQLKVGPRSMSAADARERFLEAAGETILSIYRAFNWDVVSLQMIRDNQEKFLSRRR